jgi:predicted regulator of Ras-like GTPase activity (Roadblock/LC7/MglB family)
VRTHVAEPWVEAPLQTFVDDAHALFALLLHPSGQVMGQFGFTRAVDVMAACALAAAIHASAGELGRELDGKPFRELYHAGRSRQIFIGDVPTTNHRFVFLTVFDAESSLGLVRIYFAELCALLRSAQPPLLAQAPLSAASLEQDLNRSLAMLFSRAPRGAEGGESSLPLA